MMSILSQTELAVLENLVVNETRVRPKRWFLVSCVHDFLLYLRLEMMFADAFHIFEMG